MSPQSPFKWRHVRIRDHFAVCVLVSARLAQLSRSGGDDGRARTRASIIPPCTAGGSRSAPELDKRCRPHLKATTDSWRVDETSINIKKIWTYLSRAVDSRSATRWSFS